VINVVVLLYDVGKIPIVFRFVTVIYSLYMYVQTDVNKTLVIKEERRKKRKKNQSNSRKRLLSGFYVG